jgi:tellurite resistance-related uncharacterized protein
MNPVQYVFRSSYGANKKHIEQVCEQFYENHSANHNRYVCLAVLPVGVNFLINTCNSSRVVE